MNNEKLSEALDHISDKHISEAAKQPLPKRRILLGTIAAVLAIVITVGISFAPSPAPDEGFTPFPIQAEAITLSAGRQRLSPPKQEDYPNTADWLAAKAAYSEEAHAITENSILARKLLLPFFTEGNRTFLRGDGNLIWSPANAYTGLAMAAEVTGGNTRQQILSLLGTENMEDLRDQVYAVWESSYMSNDDNICTIANSLWLENGLNFHQEALDILSTAHHASVYRGDLGTSAVDSAISTWLNNNTGGLLKNAADNIHLSQDTILALYSTLYFKGKWFDQFSAKKNTTDVFHSPNGDQNVTFMNQSLTTEYYWGNHFGAICLALRNGSKMWFILPDEGKSVEDVLQDDQYADILLNPDWKDQKSVIVNLSLPKFDISASQDLTAGLKAMGVTDAFAPGMADFSAITGDMPVHFSAASQAVRVKIDEEGVEAAAFISLPGAGGTPPDETIDFVLDRPFIFIITSSIPLFAGVVNQP